MHRNEEQEALDPNTKESGEQEQTRMRAADFEARIAKWAVELDDSEIEIELNRCCKG